MSNFILIIYIKYRYYRENIQGLLLKLENIKLLLMDEPVANLDTQSEKEISDILKNLEYSVVAVSHRNEVFKEYMKVYRMENGKLEKESV